MADAIMPHILQFRVSRETKSRRWVHMYQCVTCLKPFASVSGNTKRIKGECPDCRTSRSLRGKSVKHGVTSSKARPPIYKAWDSMRQRCLNPSHASYARYGGRGITICAEWLDSSAFLKWAASSGWSKGLQIDRIDNDKGYSPSNCRWVTCRVNQQNRNSTKLEAADIPVIRMLSWSGLSSSLIARIFGVSRRNISMVTSYKTWENA